MSPRLHHEVKSSHVPASRLTPYTHSKHRAVVKLFGRSLFNKKKKVFVIGRNKTGTTSMATILRQLGYRMGRQEEAELLLEDWGRRDFRRIIQHCHSADAFQDIPFSLPDTYRAVDENFPQSKFVLTIRSTPDAWYESLTRFHTKIVGKDRLPTGADLRQFSYRETGWIWKSHQLTYGIDDKTLYDPEIYKSHYLAHNTAVQDYFKDRPNDLLVLNVGDPDAADRLCHFLGVPGKIAQMPHRNTSRPLEPS
ncbi:MAG: sulfotransferase [Verrucomicrobiales bacterium]